MTSDDNLFTHDIGDRSIVCRKLLPGQLMMMQRMLRKWQSEMGSSDEGRGQELMDLINMTVLDVLEAQIVSPDDVQWLTQQILFGKVDLPEVRGILFGGQTATEPDDEPKVKAPAKKAARKPLKGAGRTK